MSNNATAWHLSNAQNNAQVSISRPGETGARHVVTSIVAGFNDSAIKSYVQITEAAGAALVEFRFTGQIVINGLEIVLPLGVQVGAFMPASGAGGTVGSVLLNGYTK